MIKKVKLLMEDNQISLEGEIIPLLEEEVPRGSGVVVRGNRDRGKKSNKNV